MEAVEDQKISLSLSMSVSTDALKVLVNATKRTVPEFWSKDTPNIADTNSITFPDVDNICTLPPIWPGPMGCMGFIKKWTFSKTDGNCVPYIYGGCRGTPNLFDSQSECEASCKKVSPRQRSAEVCSLPLKVGPCKAMKPSFGFNTATGRCEPFFYGGREYSLSKHL